MPPALPPTVPVCSSGGGVVAGGEVLPGAQLQGSPMAWGDSIGCRRAVPPLRPVCVVGGPWFGSAFCLSLKGCQGLGRAAPTLRGLFVGQVEHV